MNRRKWIALCLAGCLLLALSACGNPGADAENSGGTEEPTQTEEPAQAEEPTQQETLGQVVVEILSDGRNLNRKSLCTKLLSRLERADGPEEEEHYHMLLGLLFER